MDSKSNVKKKGLVHYLDVIYNKVCAIQDYFCDIDEGSYARYACLFCLLMASGFMYNFIRMPYMAPRRFYNISGPRKQEEQDKQCVLESIVVAFWYACLITAMIFLIEGAGGIIDKEKMGEDDQCWVMSVMGTHFFFMVFVVLQYTFSYKINDVPPYVYSYFNYRNREYWLGFVNNATLKYYA